MGCSRESWKARGRRRAKPVIVAAWRNCLDPKPRHRAREPASHRARSHLRSAARPGDDDDLRQPRLDRAADVPRLPGRLPLRARPAGIGGRRHGRRLSRRRRATPPSSTCIRRWASATRWARSSPPTRTARRSLITAGQQARAILPFDPFLSSARATELPRPYVKWAVEPARAEDVPLAIARAYYLAMMPPRGPVLVSVPADDWAHADRAGGAAPRQPRAAPRPGAAGRDRRGARRRRAPGLRRRRGDRPRRRLGRHAALAERHKARVFMRRCPAAAASPTTIRCSPATCRPMRERIVEQLAGHDLVLVLGAPAFTYHVEGHGPHLPAGTRLGQLIDDPDIAAWAPRQRRCCAASASACWTCWRARRRARAPPPARAAQPARAEPPARRRAPVGGLRAADAGRRCATPAASIVEEAPSARPVMHERLPIHRAEHLLRDVQRRPRLRPAGRRRRRAGAARCARRSR